MDLQSQEKISELAELHGPENLVVILGAPDPESAEIAAETVVLGDPAYAGALAGAQLGLDVYHVLEDDVRADVPDDVWEDQIGVMADILEAEALTAAVARRLRAALVGRSAARRQRGVDDPLLPVGGARDQARAGRGGAAALEDGH